MASIQDILAAAIVTFSSSPLKTIIILPIVYLVIWPVYTLLLHPLRVYPGPRLSALSRISYWIACIQGDEVRWFIKLHRKYGPAVRYGPNDLSYTDGRAWKDITGARKGAKENLIMPTFYPSPTNGVPPLLSEPNAARHAELRRMFSPAFSEKAVRGQEPLMQKYADLMVDRSRKTKTVNIAKLFDLTLFDFMSELTFGQPLGLLEGGEYSPWVGTIFQTLKILPLIQMIYFYPSIKKLFDYIEPRFITEMRISHFQHTVIRVNKLYEQRGAKPYFWNLALRPEFLSIDEMHSNSESFMLGGTETTSSLLTGLTYYLIANPDKKRLLLSEIREAFHNSQDINLEKLARLKYLNACLREALRLWPPAPTGIPRLIAPSGNYVLGKWLPGGTRVFVHPAATARSPENFRNPDRFVPERWLGDSDYKDDKREAHQPFSAGPRMCLGVNLAWHNARMLIAKLLWHFDIESDVGPDWAEANVCVVWDRKPLECHLGQSTVEVQ
ncbi:cytochrome P450 [Thozetella sp. PMI_491]|nr:cytochrome P450 [Thozetella sp. PMI_491]